MHPALLFTVVVQFCGQTPSPVIATSGAELEGFADPERCKGPGRPGHDRPRQGVSPATSTLPTVPKRTLYLDPVKKTYLTEAEAARLDTQARNNLKPSPADETFYYNTKYGSPLAYSRPVELLGARYLRSRGPEGPRLRIRRRRFTSPARHDGCGCRRCRCRPDPAGPLLSVLGSRRCSP